MALRWCTAALLLTTTASQQTTGNYPEPEFVTPLENVTVAQGRDASFTCVVRHLGPHRVAWIKADNKGVLAVHDRVLTNNARLSVLHSDLHTWTLQIRDVRRSDRGPYMCVINTDPMRSQTGFLEVVIPPDIIAEDGAGEVLVPEGGSARLSCRARGVPQPRVIWRREDGQDIIVRSPGSPKNRVTSYEGETLILHKITRSEIGSFLCIAANGVPPPVSRRVVVNVHFYPTIQVPSQLVGAPIGTNVTLECFVEASPRPINYWSRDTGEIIISSDKYRMEETEINAYTSRLRLHLRLTTSHDFGAYRCSSKNSIGDAEGIVRVYEIKLPTRETPTWKDHEDEDDLEAEEGDVSSHERTEEETQKIWATPPPSSYAGTTPKALTDPPQYRHRPGPTSRSSSSSSSSSGARCSTHGLCTVVILIGLAVAGLRTTLKCGCQLC